MSYSEILHVINLYAIALDSHSWHLFDNIFTSDVVADFPAEQRWFGLESFKRDFAKMHEATAGHQHIIGPTEIIINGDLAFALSYGRFNFFRISPAVENTDMFQGGAWYDDELIRTPEGWRIRKRIARNFWWKGAPPPDGPYPMVIESFPEWARTGRVAYLNALNERTGSATA